MTTGLYKKGLIFAIVCCFFVGVFVPIICGNNKFNAPPSIEWNKTYGGVDDDWGMSLQQTNDDGFIFCCGTKSYGGGVPEPLIDPKSLVPPQTISPKFFSAAST